MNSFITYLLQSSLCLTVFLLFYLLLLKKETYYSGNRAYLLITGCFSVVMPIFRFLLPSTGYAKEITYFMAPVFVAGTAKVSNPWKYISLIPEIIYFVVLTLLLLKFLFRLMQIFLLIKNNESVNLKGQKIVLLEKGNTPFSFFNIIFMTREQMMDLSFDKIIAHEKMHTQQFHSVDILLFELIKIIQWFNPFAWKFKKEIEAQHEFSADSGIISDGTNLNDYKNVLLAYSIGIVGGTITNNFNSLLKRRFEMLSIKRSNALGKVKFLFTLPLMVFLIFLIGVVNGSISFASESKQGDPKDKIVLYCDHMPGFPGGEDGLFEIMKDNLVYPETAKRAGIEGKVYVSFVVDKDGSVTNVEILKGIGAGCDEEAERVVNLMPKWEPGRDKGKLVRVKIAVPVVFSLK